MKVHMFWEGSPLSLYENACIRSVVRCGAEVNLYTFTKNLKVPAGVRRRDAREIATQEESRLFTQDGQKASITAFSNLFRYRLLAEEGGWWLDADVFCLREAEAFESVALQSRGLVAAYSIPGEANTAVLHISDRSIARALATRAWEVSERHRFDFPWGTQGPHLLTALVAENPGPCTILPKDVFYPIQWDRTSLFFCPEDRELCLDLTRNSLAVHLFNEVLKRSNVPKDVLPNQGSYLFDLFVSVEPVSWVQRLRDRLRRQRRA